MVELSEEVQGVVGVLADKGVCRLNKREMARFRRVVSWEEGGEVAPYPTAAEKAVRRRREAWKRRRAGKGKGKEEPCLFYKAEQIRCVKKNIRRDRWTARWFERLTAIADGVAALPGETFTRLIEDP